MLAFPYLRQQSSGKILCHNSHRACQINQNSATAKKMLLMPASPRHPFLFHVLQEGRMWTKRADGLDTLMEVAFGDGIAGWVAETESPVVTHDVEKDNRFDFRIDTAYAAGAFEMTRKVSGILSIPMKKHDGTLFGVCSMIHMQGNTFTRGDQRLLEVHCELTVLSFKACKMQNSNFSAFETPSEALKRCQMLLRAKWVHFFRAVLKCVM